MLSDLNENFDLKEAPSNLEMKALLREIF